MNTFKKLFTTLIALALLFVGMTPVLGANKPTSSDKADIEVSGLEAGDQITVYQIVKADYSDAGFVDYVYADSYDEDDFVNRYKPTAKEVTTAVKAGNLHNDTGPATADASGKATIEVPAGYYIVLVTKTNNETVVYNPMLAGVAYDETKSGSDNALKKAEINATGNWTLDDTEVYAKKSTVPFDKVIDEGDGVKGNIVAVGDTVNYKITTTIPSYSDSRDTLTWKIEDTLESGKLKLKGDVTVEGIASGDYTLTKTDGGFTLSMTAAQLKKYAAKSASERAVTITYSAELQKGADTNFDPNTNTAKITYTNNSSEKTETVVTNTYTFELTFKKVDDKNQPLAGAKFTLTGNGKTYTATSGADGTFTFTGLDEGTYTLSETEAPATYAALGEDITVVIKDTNIDATGKLTTYTVDVKSDAIKLNNSNTHTTDPTDEEAVIPNTKIQDLPSTGGMGTYIFTIAGVAIMVLALVIYNRMKHSENE